MKTPKKLPTKRLEKYSAIFTQLGLVLALFIVYAALEYETEQKVFSDTFKYDEVEDVYLEEEQQVIFKKKAKVVPKTKAPKPKPFIKDEVVKVEDDDIEKDFFDDPVDDEPPVLDPDKIIEADEPDDEPEPETVPFLIIEDVPVFPGCKGSKSDLKKCFSKMIQKHFLRKFDAGLPNELGLAPGRKNIFIGFKIDKNGNVIDIQTAAPHPKIKEEVIRVMKSLPKMKPGKQRGRPVGVKYNMPLKIVVE